MLPHWLELHIQGWNLTEITIGRSDSRVFRLDQSGSQPRYLKLAIGQPATELQLEIERLHWLQGRTLVPQILHEVRYENEVALFTSALPGLSLVHVPKNEFKEHAELIGRALKQLHRIDISDCPFLHSSEGGPESPDGLLDPPKLTIYHELIQRFPEHENRVFLHGDPSLPNIFAKNGEFSGWIDLGSAGIGNPYRDVALALWSLNYNYGPGFDNALLDSYHN